LPALGILTPLAGLAALWAAKNPAHAQLLSTVFVPTATVISIMLWSSAARLRVHTSKDKDKASITPS
jgi:hypothetical protein